MRRHLVGLVFTGLPSLACSLAPEGVSFDSAGTPAGSATKADDLGDTDDGLEDVDDGTDIETTDGSSDEDSECGNGIREGNEQCDEDDLGDDHCQDFGFEDGVLACGAACFIQTEGCYSCGDGTKQAAEVCDGDDLGGATCMSQGLGAGTLTCGADCQSFDTSGCGLCGNDVVDPGEQCDGNDLGGNTCQSQGFDQGQLGCTASCTFNTAGCSNNQACGSGGSLCASGADCCTGLCVIGLCA
jgi:hypothetical protein